MGVAPPQVRFDAQSYSTCEAAQAVRPEWVDGEVYAIAGAGVAHNRVSLNIDADLPLDVVYDDVVPLAA